MQKEKINITFTDNGIISKEEFGGLLVLEYEESGKTISNEQKIVVYLGTKVANLIDQALQENKLIEGVKIEIKVSE